MDQSVSKGGASLKVEGQQRLVDLMGKVSDPNKRLPLMAAIGAYGVSSTQQRFQDEKAPDGTAWKKSYRAEKQGGKTLRKSTSSGLYSSLTFEETRDSATWGTNKVYAGVHQFGAVIRPRTKRSLAFRLADGKFVLTKKVTIPARPYLGINAYDEGRILGLGETWLKRLLDGAAA